MTRSADAGPIHALCQLDERVAEARRLREPVRLRAALQARAGVWSLLAQTMCLDGTMTSEAVAHASLRCEHAAKLDQEEADALGDRIAGVRR